MAAGRLLSTREVARLLGLPESTVRWYGRQFHDFLPILRDARGVWWNPEALPIIRTIRESFAAGLAREDVAHVLASGLPHTPPSPQAERARKTVIADVAARAQALEALQADVAQLRKGVENLAQALTWQTEQWKRQEVLLQTLVQTVQRLEDRLTPPGPSPEDHSQPPRPKARWGTSWRHPRG